MVARRFLITLQQVIRSVLIILFPLAFITLFAWATAGSTNGTTSDPMRAALWLWLGSHLTPFHITSNEITGYLSYLPLGAVILPWLSMRVGFRRIVAVIENKKMSRAYFILTYLITYSLLALIASNSQVSVDYPRGIAILLFLLFLATTTVNFEILVKLPGQLFLIMLGLSGLVFSLNLLVNFSIAKNLTIVLHPGIIGGILLLMVQILYLPNLFFSTFSYILGSGFSLGSATDITPFIFNLREIPAIPVLAALPAGKFPWIITLSIMLFVYALINLNKIKALDIDKKSKQQLYLRFLIISVLGSAILAFVSSGSLISANMNPVGVNPLRIGAIVFGHILLAFIATQYFPKLFKKKVKQSRLTT
jgi:Family of unknown function (DUF6350)